MTTIYNSVGWTVKKVETEEEAKSLCNKENGWFYSTWSI